VFKLLVIMSESNIAIKPDSASANKTTEKNLDKAS